MAKRHRERAPTVDDRLSRLEWLHRGAQQQHTVSLEFPDEPKPLVVRLVARCEVTGCWCGRLPNGELRLVPGKVVDKAWRSGRAGKVPE